ncbi:MAG: LysR family transcriptional regulator [Candidatus Thiodiazotropha sp. (ex Cardiolucina cf. quadrata)]|nr:LysR family transcriptional regulator [Candidatus Thiodiazotropha sp. (ex Cardiolucina cf. quadrata)]
MVKRASFGGQISDADIRLLRIFRVVVENGGFSSAEIELNISISAISIAINDLEKRLGMKLCQRGRAGFSLTDEGAEVYQAILQLLASLENFKTQVNSISAHLKGELNIGVTDNLVTMSNHMRVTNSLSALKQLGPEVRINIRMMPPSEIEKSVLDGRLHIGVIPDFRHLAGLEFIDLYDEDSLLYCGHKHELFARDNSQLSEADIHQLDAVFPAAAVPLENKSLLQIMRPAATATDREGAAFLILSGQYVAFLPVHYAERWVEKEKMRALLPERYRFKTRYAAITRKGARPNLVLQTFIKELNRPENDLTD